MNCEKWAKIIRNSRNMLMAAHDKALAAGLVDPVMILIDPREGCANQFARDNLGQNAADVICRLIAAAQEQSQLAGEEKTPLLHFPIERERLRPMLPPRVLLWNADHFQQFVVV